MSKVRQVLPWACAADLEDPSRSLTRLRVGAGGMLPAVIMMTLANHVSHNCLSTSALI